MLAKHTLRIDILGLALAFCACGDNGKSNAIDAPVEDIDAAMSPPIDAPVVDAFVPQDAPPDAFVAPNLAPNPGVEDNETGWTTNGGPSPKIARSTEQFHSGTASLLATERAGNWNGPAVDITSKVAPGKHYAMSAFVRLVEPGTATFWLSTRPVCQERAEPIFNDKAMRTSATVPDNQTWVMLSTTFEVRLPVLEPPDPAVPVCTLIDFKVYVETVAGTAAFYVDDISITEAPPAPAIRSL